MSSKTRYKVETSYALKKAYLRMVRNFNVSQVSSNRRKDGSYVIYFAVKDSSEEVKMKEFFDNRGIELEKL